MEGNMKTKPLTYLLSLTFLVLFSGSVYGDDLQDFQDGFDAARKGDHQTAYKLWLPLAEQGVAEAQYNLGLMYFKGEGVPQDYKEAVKWWKLSAEQGDASAQFNLGQMYRKGQGVPQDYKEAVRLYRLSAEQGDAYAQHNLGNRYAQGQGVPQDYVSAHMWFNLAGINGDKSAVKNRNIVEKKMTPSQIEKAQRLARNWKPSYR